MPRIYRFNGRYLFRNWRLKHHMTQAQFAQALGVATRTISYIEAGCYQPSISTQQKFDRLKENYSRERKFWKNARKDFAESPQRPGNRDCDKRSHLPQTAL